MLWYELHHDFEPLPEPRRRAEPVVPRDRNLEPVAWRDMWRPFAGLRAEGAINPPPLPEPAPPPMPGVRNIHFDHEAGVWVHNDVDPIENDF